MFRELSAVVVLALVSSTIQADDGSDADSRCRIMFDWIVAEPVRFVQSAEELRLSSQPVLLRLAEFMFDCPAYTIAIRGHTDNVGDEAFNRALSEKRAAAIAGFLASHGVDRDRLAVSGAGSSEPVADNDTAWGRDQNRRIEFRLLPPGGAAR